MIRVLLVDDQDLVRAGLRQILSLERDLVVVDEAANGIEALSILDAGTSDTGDTGSGDTGSDDSAVDVVLMDIRMREMDGIEATKIIRDREGPPVLALTTFDDDETLWGAIDAGVAGFVLKEAPGEDIVRATRLVAGGGAWLDPSVTERVLSVSRRDGSRPARTSLASADPLTRREHEVLVLMATGASNPEIAAELHVGAATIKSHVSAIFSKLGVRDRAGAIVFAYQNDLAG